MKTKITSTLLAAIIVLAAFATTAAILEEPIISNSNSKSVCTNAIKYNGKIIPQVTLPVVNIYGKQTASLKSAIPVVELPEVVITAQKSNGGYCVRAIEYNGKFIPVINLPYVVIVAPRNIVSAANVTAGIPVENFIETSVSGLPVMIVYLPQVEITASQPDSKQLAAYFNSVLNDEVESGQSNLFQNQVMIVYYTEAMLKKLGVMFEKMDMSKIQISR
ncbi:MAG: hypothetical protein ACHQNT_12710 [Bacteroidia bacterium]